MMRPIPQATAAEQAELAALSDRIFDEAIKTLRPDFQGAVAMAIMERAIHAMANFRRRPEEETRRFIADMILGSNKLPRGVDSHAHQGVVELDGRACVMLLIRQSLDAEIGMMLNPKDPDALASMTAALTKLSREVFKHAGLSPEPAASDSAVSN